MHPTQPGINTVFNFNDINLEFGTTFSPVTVDFNNTRTISLTEVISITIIGTPPPQFDIGSYTSFNDGTFQYDGWTVKQNSEFAVQYGYNAITTHQMISPIPTGSPNIYTVTLTSTVTAVLTTLTNEVFSTTVEITGTPVFPFALKDGTINTLDKTFTFTTSNSSWEGVLTFSSDYFIQFNNTNAGNVTETNLVRNSDSTWTYTYRFPQTAVFFSIPNPITEEAGLRLQPEIFIFQVATGASYPVIVGNNSNTPITTPTGILSPYGAFLFAPTVSCFLAGSLVTLADGSTKPIEEIQVGDTVRGAFGEINTVLQLKRGTLEQGRMCKINGEHATTLNHPHITPTKKFVSYNGAIASNGVECMDIHSIMVNKATDAAYYSLFELTRGRIQPAKIGTELQSVTGPKTIDTIEMLDLPADTPIYNLAVSGSHTYFVNGYAVTGDMKESDFDVDAWIPK